METRRLAGVAKGFLTGWRRLTVIFVLALVIRIAYLVQMGDNLSFQIIALDSELFDQTAHEIIGGNWGSAVFYSAPLYPYFLALLYAVFGSGFLVARIAQVILGSLTAVLVIRLSESLFDEPVPLAAGLVTALYGPFIFFNATILGTTLATFLAALGVFLFSRSRLAPGRVGLLTFLAGAVIGLTSLGRPNTVLVLPLWVLCLWILDRGRQWIRPAALLLLGSALVIGPVTIRNAVVGHDFVPISSHGGINFWIGNHPNALGTFDLPPGIRGTPEQVNLIDSTRLATGAVGHALKPSEVSSFWFGKGLEYMRDNPGEYAALLLRKIRMFWNRFEIPLNVNFHFLRHYSPFLRVPLMHFGAVSPLAILGIALSLPLWKRMLPAYAFVAVYFLSAAVFFVSARYRLPAVPVLIPFACYATWWFYRKIRHRKWKPVSIAAAVLVVLTVHANAPVAGMSEQRSFGRDYYYLACQHRSKGHITEAIANYRESLAHNPDFWMAHNGLGICLSEIDRMEEAVESFERAMALAPTRSEPWFNMGTALATHGRVPEAVRKWERALELDPYDKAARSNLERARKLMQAGPQGE